jgi:citrate lyase subunit beta/citryl-CoA lyase
MPARAPALRCPALLFCPGDRPDRFDKAAAAADTVVLDLEDAVAPEHKERARNEVVRALGRLDPPGPSCGSTPRERPGTSRPLRPASPPKHASIPPRSFGRPGLKVHSAIAAARAVVLAIVGLGIDPSTKAPVW